MKLLAGLAPDDDRHHGKIAIDLTGQRFGRLVAVRRVRNVSPSPSRPMGHVAWLCRCDCGSTTTVMRMNLRAGATLSCGCFRADSSRGVSERMRRERAELARLVPMARAALRAV